MKKLIIYIFLFSGLLVYSQASDRAIVNAYIKRAENAMENLECKQALKNFNKALSRLDTITNRKIARLGSQIYFELHHKEETLKEQLSFLNIAREYLNQYFRIYKKDKTEEYASAIDDQLLFEDTLEELENKIKEQEAEELRMKIEREKIDSLKTVWKNTSKRLSLKIDSIFEFNKNNIALIKNKGFYGLIDHFGSIIINADEFKDVICFDGLYIFKNTEIDPTKLFYYNSFTKISYQLPLISDFYTLSTHFGKVMLPRGNGRLVTYPNNSTKAFVYDLNVRKVVRVANEKELFKNLDKSDAIDKYNKDGQVKVNKEWYNFGGHLGGGIHPLYAEEGYELKGFLCSLDGRFLNVVRDYQNIGAFYNGKFEALKGTERVWVNQNGTKVSKAKNEAGEYKGSVKVIKLEDGSYQLMKDGYIILRNEKLEKMSEFLRSNR